MRRNDSQDWQRWMQYAQEDLTAAVSGMGSDDSIPRHICGHAQQAAEKAIKAVLVHLSVDFPPSHNLNTLRALMPSGWAVTSDYDDLSELTEWVSESRYPV
ncbi:MAG: HEPN domain-containing protein, partial [Candidatus Poribacteria bacterium]|nr:HEPN domain-containing protein [Candidatus Poribacteria bacterium]